MESIIKKIEKIAVDSDMGAMEKLNLAVSHLYQGSEPCFAEELAPLFRRIIAQGVGEGVFNTEYSDEYAELFIVALLYLNRRKGERHKEAFAYAMELLLGTELGAFDIIKESSLCYEKSPC